MARVPPPDPSKLDAIFDDVERVFRDHSADNHDRIDVLAKHLGFAFWFSKMPDQDEAFAEFVWMARQYMLRLVVLNTKPEGSA